MINVGGGALAFVDALAFDGNDVLYAIDANNSLYTVDTSNGNATLIGNTGVIPSPFLVGLAFDPVTGRLYSSTGGLGGADAIFEINPTTGAATAQTRQGRGRKAGADSASQPAAAANATASATRGSSRSG